jgi:hypothetical protein
VEPVVVRTQELLSGMIQGRLEVVPLMVEPTRVLEVLVQALKASDT